LQLVWDHTSPALQTGDAVTLGIRPEHLLIDQASDATWIGAVRLAEYLGSETMIYLNGADGAELSVKADGLAKVKIGTTLQIGIPKRACHIFDRTGRAILNGDLS
jgi:multiple sugar transport system ATP-binding protein